MIRRFITWLIRPSVEAIIAEHRQLDLAARRAHHERMRRWARQEAAWIAARRGVSEAVE